METQTNSIMNPNAWMISKNEVVFVSGYAAQLARKVGVSEQAFRARTKNNEKFVSNGWFVCPCEILTRKSSSNEN